MALGAVPRRRGFIDYGRLAAEAGAVCRRLGLDVALDRPVESLPLGQRQMVEIAKALYRRPRVLILDEPTSSLTAHEVRTLFGLLRELRREGVAILYISHRLNEVLELCDYVTVLKDGERTADQPLAGSDPARAGPPDGRPRPGRPLPAATGRACRASSRSRSRGCRPDGVRRRRPRGPARRDPGPRRAGRPGAGGGAARRSSARCPPALPASRSATAPAAAAGTAGGDRGAASPTSRPTASARRLLLPLPIALQPRPAGPRSPRRPRACAGSGPRPRRRGG